MKRKSNRVAAVLAFVFGIGLSAVQANAQQGTFNLPVRAHWGTAILEPGEHRVQMPLPVNQRFLFLRSGQATQITMPLTTEIIAGSNRNFLHLSKVNGEYYVDAYQCGAGNQRFTFHKPKAIGVTAHEPKDQEAKLITVTGS